LMFNATIRDGNTKQAITYSGSRHNWGFGF
jgi:hypothetical protein